MLKLAHFETFHVGGIERPVSNRMFGPDRPWLEVDGLAEDGICGNGPILMMEDNNACLALRAGAERSRFG